MLRFLWRVVKSQSERGGEEKKRLLWGGNQEGVIGKKQVVVFIVKREHLVCHSPTIPPPPTSRSTRIMSPCWCHIDYADRKLPLFVPSSLPSVTRLRGRAAVTLKAIVSVFSAFFRSRRRYHRSLRRLPPPPATPLFLSHSDVLIAF